MQGHENETAPQGGGESTELGGSAKKYTSPQSEAQARFDAALLDSIDGINKAVKRHKLTRDESLALFAEFGYVFMQVSE